MSRPLQTVLTALLVVALVVAAGTAFWLSGELDRTRAERDIARDQVAQLSADLEEAEGRIAALEAGDGDAVGEPGDDVPPWAAELWRQFSSGEDPDLTLDEIMGLLRWLSPEGEDRGPWRELLEGFVG